MISLKKISLFFALVVLTAACTVRPVVSDIPEDAISRIQYANRVVCEYKGKVVVRYLYMNTKGQPEGLTAAFIDYIYSLEGQKIIEEDGYIPLPRK